MIVRCDIQQCGFYDRGFCRNKTLSIIGGHCSILFNKRTGLIYPDVMMPIGEEYKENLIIEDGEINNGTESEYDDSIGVHDEVPDDDNGEHGVNSVQS